MMTKVAEDAIRMVQRMSMDWMVMGRRPSGVCGACLILAARMNNFRRTITEVVYIVKVTTHTIQKRLEEFKQTPSSALTVEEFLHNEFLESATIPHHSMRRLKSSKRLRSAASAKVMMENTRMKTAQEAKTVKVKAQAQTSVKRRPTQKLHPVPTQQQTIRPPLVPREPHNLLLLNPLLNSVVMLMDLSFHHNLLSHMIFQSTLNSLRALSRNSLVPLWKG